MEDKLVCPICGETTFSYMGNYRKDRLCKKHSQELKSGDLIKCSKCDKYHYKDETCECEKNKFVKLPQEGYDKCVSCGAPTKGYAFCIKCYKKYTPEELLAKLNESTKHDTETVEEVKTSNNEEAIQTSKVTIDSNNKSRCITCGMKTDGLLFCGTCYHKYNKKELLFRVTNCTSIELLDEDYEGKYTCKDGHIVKSKSERDIDNYLFEHGISHAYEKELPYGATEKTVLHPDFCLPNYLGPGNDVYIEHWGYNENNIQYTKTKKFKMPIYEKLGITLICTYEKTDMGKIDTVLDRKLNKLFIKINSINFEE